MPPAESRVKMNGFAAPDTAAVICSAAIKRGFAAPSPGFPAHNFIFSESNLRKILDSTVLFSYNSYWFVGISAFLSATEEDLSLPANNINGRTNPPANIKEKRHCYAEHIRAGTV